MFKGLKLKFAVAFGFCFYALNAGASYINAPNSGKTLGANKNAINLGVNTQISAISDDFVNSLNEGSIRYARGLTDKLDLGVLIYTQPLKEYKNVHFALQPTYNFVSAADDKFFVSGQLGVFSNYKFSSFGGSLGPAVSYILDPIEFAYAFSYNFERGKAEGAEASNHQYMKHRFGITYLAADSFALTPNINYLYSVSGTPSTLSTVQMKELILGLDLTFKF